MENKKMSSKNYKNKRRIYTTEDDAPFMKPFFSEKDTKLIMEDSSLNGCFEHLTKMLNEIVKGCAHFFPHTIELQPGKVDEMNLLKNLNLVMKKLRKSYSILFKQYGDATLVYMDLKYSDYQQIQNFLEIQDQKISKGIKSVSKSLGKKRGPKSHIAIKGLIRSLILVYEKISDQKVEDNFKQPKTGGASFQGQFYKFAYAVFNIINNNFDKYYADSKNEKPKKIFHILLKGSSSLGNHIHSVIEERTFS